MLVETGDLGAEASTGATWQHQHLPRPRLHQARPHLTDALPSLLPLLALLPRPQLPRAAGHRPAAPGQSRVHPRDHVCVRLATAALPRRRLLASTPPLCFGPAHMGMVLLQRGLLLADAQTCGSTTQRWEDHPFEVLPGLHGPQESHHSASALLAQCLLAFLPIASGRDRRQHHQPGAALEAANRRQGGSKHADCAPAAPQTLDPHARVVATELPHSPRGLDARRSGQYLSVLPGSKHPLPKHAKKTAQRPGAEHRLGPGALRGRPPAALLRCGRNISAPGL
mmetsp:Transcript_47157/g.119365  ORF Transcript_47157/g.119365 Transcript_47157/m.119365 type:complete len:282 (-) Transcript_47157:529-1374(-)